MFFISSTLFVVPELLAISKMDEMKSSASLLSQSSQNSNHEHQKSSDLTPPSIPPGLGGRHSLLYMTRTNSLLSKGPTLSRLPHTLTKKSSFHKTRKDGSKRDVKSPISSVKSSNTNKNNSGKVKEKVKSPEIIQKEFTFTGYEIENDGKPLPPIGGSIRKVKDKTKIKVNHRRVYLECCNKMGILPLTQVMSSIEKPQMKLKTCGLGVKGRSIYFFLTNLILQRLQEFLYVL